MYKGMLISFTETGKENESELKSWFVNEHIDERALNTDGFFRARLYECLDNGPKFFATYETSNFEVLRSENYMEKVSNQTDWSKKIIPKLTLLDRITGQITLNKLHGYSGQIFVFRFLPLKDEKLISVLRDTLNTSFNQILEYDFINGVCLVENDSKISTSTGKKAQNIGGKPNLRIEDEWIIILEGYDITELKKVINNIYNEVVKNKYVEKKISVNSYQLIYGSNR